MAKKLLLRIRYPDDPDREWITLEREKEPRKRPDLTAEQEYWLGHSRIWARVATVFIVLFFVMCLRGCNL